MVLKRSLTAAVPPVSQGIREVVPRFPRGTTSRPAATLFDGMYLGLDHLVIAVPDPDDAAAEREDALGLAATGGGRHHAFGTSTGPESGDEARAARAAQVHPFGGGARLVSLELAAADPAAVARAYRATVDLACLPGPGQEARDWEVRVGEQDVRLVPSTPGDPPARIGILGLGVPGGHVLVDLFGCRFVRV